MMTLPSSLEQETKFREVCTIAEKAPTRVFSLLKTSSFIFKDLLRHYAKLNRLLSRQSIEYGQVG